MQRPPWPIVAAIAGVAAVGVGSAIAVYLVPQQINLAVSAAALAIALMLVAMIAIRDIQFSRRLADALDGRHHLDRLTRNIESLGLRLDDIEDRLDPVPGTEEYTSPMPELSSPSSLVDELENLRRTIGNFAAEHGVGLTAPPAEPPIASAETPEHRLELFLEPLVTLATGNTAHYRSAIVLEAEDGRHVPYQELSRQLGRHQLRPSLDLRCLARALPLTRKLAIRRNDSLIFVPVGGETLAHADSMEQLGSLLAAEEGVPAAIVFEIDHAAMAVLSKQGVECLASLSRHGAGMALTHIAHERVDLAALRDLRFGYLCFPAASLPPRGKPEWAPLSQFAADHGFDIVIHGLESDQQVEQAKIWATFGSGPRFAPPRRVKSNTSVARSYSAAA